MHLRMVTGVGESNPGGWSERREQRMGKLLDWSQGFRCHDILRQDMHTSACSNLTDLMDFWGNIHVKCTLHILCTLTTKQLI